MSSKQPNYPKHIVAQITLISAISLLLVFVLLITSLNYLYKKNEQELAREKISILWTEIFPFAQQGNFDTFRNTYNRDLNESEKIYAVRITSSNNIPLLFEYPKVWEKYFNLEMDFSSHTSTDKPYRLKIIQNDKKTPSNFVIYSLPLANYNIQIIISIEERLQFLATVIKSGFFIFLGIIILSVIVSNIVIRRTLKPLEDINSIIESIITKQNLEERLKEIGNSEFIRIQKNFNIMLDVIEQQVNRLRQATIYLGHDIRTPLTRIRNELEEILKTTHAQSPDKDRLENCLVFIDDIKQFTKQVLDLSEIDPKLVYIPAHPINVASTVENVVEMYSLIAEEKNITIKTDIDPSIEIYMDQIRIRQLLGNLLDNAVKFNKKNETVDIKIYKKNHINIFEIQDTGIGIPEEHLPHIWTPSWSGVQNEKPGSGFGLAIVESIVKAYQGAIKVVSKKGEGTRFTISFKITRL